MVGRQPVQSWDLGADRGWGRLGGRGRPLAPPRRVVRMCEWVWAVASGKLRSRGAPDGRTPSGAPLGAAQSPTNRSSTNIPSVSKRGAVAASLQRCRFPRWRRWIFGNFEKLKLLSTFLERENDRETFSTRLMDRLYTLAPSLLKIFRLASACGPRQGDALTPPHRKWPSWAAAPPRLSEP